jgi:hypothetical protein
MAKFYGVIGYGVSGETEPGVYAVGTTERSYFGDVLNRTWRFESSESANDDINIANRISIVADEFAYENSYAMRYVEFKGVRWKVTSVEVLPPRLILTIGGVYNGE